MLLEARPMGWFSNTIELRLNGNLVGTVRPKWFSEGLELELLQHPVRFEKPSWLRSHFVLNDAQGIELGSATLEGFFGQRWEMNLNSGPGTLERAGWFTSEYVLKQRESITARVSLTNWFSRNWQVVADDTLSAVDVLLIGLVYTVVKHREAQQHST
jgi:hypothetical protein